MWLPETKSSGSAQASSACTADRIQYSDVTFPESMQAVSVAEVRDIDDAIDGSGLRLTGQGTKIRATSLQLDTMYVCAALTCCGDLTFLTSWCEV
jgi:hypothetical protein